MDKVVKYWMRVCVQYPQKVLEQQKKKKKKEGKHPLIISGCSHTRALLINYYHKRVKHQFWVFTEEAIHSDGNSIVGAKCCIARHLQSV